jgi:hypothetical protein
MLNQAPKALEYWEKALALDPTNKKLAAKIAAGKSRVSKSDPTAASPLK